jgi:hypothetical protein
MPKSSRPVEFGAAAPLPKMPNCIAPICFQQSITVEINASEISPNPYLDYPHIAAA